jgi:hypothetical protein
MDLIDHGLHQMRVKYGLAVYYLRSPQHGSRRAVGSMAKKCNQWATAMGPNRSPTNQGCISFRGRIVSGQVGDNPTRSIIYGAALYTPVVEHTLAMRWVEPEYLPRR